MESLHYLLMKAHTRFHRNIMSRAAKLGLSPGQPKVLEYLLQHGESDQKTLALYCEIEPATAGSILNRMETAGLIRRERHEGNRRSLYVTLTREGKEAAEKMESIFMESEKRAAAGLTAEEREMLAALLEKVSNALSE